MPDFDTYLSPFTWRYGTPAMRRLWSETNKRLLWRRIWVTLAEVQAEYGLVTPEQVADLRLHMEEVDLPRALEIEAEIPSGAPENVVRTVTENSRTLKFTSQGFEKE